MIRTLLIARLFLCGVALFASCLTFAGTVPSRQSVNRYQYLFVAGFFNELVRDHYFKVNQEALEKMGAEHIDIVFPSSYNAARTTAEHLRDMILLKYHENNQKPLILIGHSMGGLSSLAALLHFPELVTEGIVHEFVAAMSPLRGNLFIDSQDFLTKCMVCPLRSFFPGFASLHTEPIRELIEGQISKLDRPTRELLSRKVHYVIAHEDPNHFSKALAMGKMILNTRIEYDGLVAKKDMWIPGFGNVIADLKVDHLELVLGNDRLIGSEFSKEKILKFTQSLVQSVLNKKSQTLACPVAVGL